jgi:hypothetical protein
MTFARTLLPEYLLLPTTDNSILQATSVVRHAIEAPRMLIGNAANGSRVTIEDRIPRTLLERLEAMGHSFREDRAQGRGGPGLRDSGDRQRRQRHCGSRGRPPAITRGVKAPQGRRSICYEA